MKRKKRYSMLGVPDTHGAYVNGVELPEHYVWREMHRRCNHNLRYWKDVRVCKRWRSYENFIADMGYRPTPDHTLDRYPDPFGDYKPSNCRWATYTEQMKNRRFTPHFERGGYIGTVGDWAKKLGMSTPKARYRWNAWGTFEKGKVWKCVPPKALRRQRSKNISLALALGIASQ